MSMWEFRDEVVRSDASIVGYDVEATDGSIGKIDDHSAEAGSQFVVVDTGWWIFGKKRLVPAGVIQRVDDTEQKVYVSMTRDQIKDAPDWVEDARSKHDDYANYYEPYGQVPSTTDLPPTQQTQPGKTI